MSWFLSFKTVWYRNIQIKATSGEVLFCDAIYYAVRVSSNVRSVDEILKSGHSTLLGEVYYEASFESRMWTTPFSIIFLRSASFYNILVFFFNIDLIKSVHLGGKGLLHSLALFVDLLLSYSCHVAYRFVHSCAILSCSFLSWTYCVAMLPTNGSAEKRMEKKLTNLILHVPSWVGWDGLGGVCTDSVYTRLNRWYKQS